MEENNFAVLVDAKSEYTNQLINILKQYLYTGIKDIYIDAKLHCEDNNDKYNTLQKFQSLLSNVPTWNQEIITQITRQLIEDSGCDWI